MPATRSTSVESPATWQILTTTRDGGRFRRRCPTRNARKKDCPLDSARSPNFPPLAFGGPSVVASSHGSANYSGLRKRKFVAKMSEDDFRDLLVRPLFLRKNFVHGAELCGPTEAGKDCFFRTPAPFGGDYVAVLQTKTGNMNMGREPAKNVQEAATQLRTAMAANLQDIKTKQKRRPNFGYLCASGQINEQAKSHILEGRSKPQLNIPRYRRSHPRD